METQDRRRHPRHDIVMAVMLTPNGDRHMARVMDLSEGGACVGLSKGWIPPAGMPLRVLFQVHSADIVSLEAKVTRVARDHVGVEFEPLQDSRIHQLLRDVGMMH
jgi:hypothetical protein